MLWLDGLLGKEGKGSYGWLLRVVVKMNPVLMPPVLDTCRTWNWKLKR